MKIARLGKSRRFLSKAAFLGIAACVVVPTAVAQFNTDALKSIQKEGHKILEEEQSKRAFKLSGNLCLDTAGATLTVRACSDSATQDWRLDDQRRLVANSGQCVVGAVLRACGQSKNQLWRHDGQKRLINDAGTCLQAQGNPLKAGARVAAVACSKAASQVWN